MAGVRLFTGYPTRTGELDVIAVVHRRRRRRAQEPWLSIQSLRAKAPLISLAAHARHLIRPNGRLITHPESEDTLRGTRRFRTQGLDLE